MAPQAVTWVLTLIDRMTAPARRARSETERLERALGRLDRSVNRLAVAQAMNARVAQRSAQQMDSAYGKTESRLGRLRARVGQLRTGMLALGGAGITAAGVGFTKAAIGGMSQREGSLQSLGVLLKTRDQAQIKSAASWIGQFADVTPFEDPQVMDSVRQLLASQFSFGQTMGIARITGDTASALGSNTADAAFKWEIINRALGQIKSKGRVQGDELLQMAEAGINPYKYLEQAFGPNWRKMQEGGKIGANAGISAILKGLNDDFGGAMDTMSKTFSGLASTLASRPKRILGQMFDEGGLEQPKRFMENLVRLTDFSKEPGARILKRLAGYGKRFMDALFGPLANATSGDQLAVTLKRVMGQIDSFVGMVERAAPTIRAVLDGMVGGFTVIWRILRAIMAPVVRVMKMLGWLGDNDATGLGKMVGYLIAGAIAMKLFGLGFGMLLGPVPMIVGLHLALAGLAQVLPRLAAGGVISAGTLARLTAVLRPLIVVSRAFAIVFGGWHGRVIGLATGGARLVSSFLVPFVAGWSRFTRLLGAGRGVWAALQGAVAFGSRFGWVARILPMIGRFGRFLLPLFGRLAGVLAGPVGWVLTLVSLGYELYKRWEPFRNFIDGLADGFREAAQSAIKWFQSIPEKLAGMGARLYEILFPQWVRDGLARWGVNLPAPAQTVTPVGAPVPLATGGNASVAALTGVAQRLGIDPQALLAVAFKESSLNPAAAFKDKQGNVKAAGLIQFTETTAGAYGLTLDRILKMSPEQQAPFIERYLREAGVQRGASLEQVYAAVFGGNANKTGRVLYTRADGGAYTNNIGLDENKDGQITSMEAAAAAAKAWRGVSSTFAPNITINAYGNFSPQFANDVGGAAGSAVGNALDIYAREQGAGVPGGFQQ